MDSDNITLMFSSFTFKYDNFTTNISTLASDDDFDRETYIADMLNIICRPFLFTLGTIGNVISIIVLQSGSLKRLSTCYYLSLLALADTGMLWSGAFLTWLGYVSNWKFTPYTWFGGFSCKLHYYTDFGFSHISTSTLTVTAVEKFINIYFPLKARELCTVTTAKRIMIIIVLIFVLFEAQWFYIIDYEKETNECKTMSERTTKISNLYKHFDAMLYSYIPICTMVLCNIAIILKLIIAKLKSGDSHAGSTSMSKAAKGITIMLVGTNIWFIILTLPYAMMYNVHLDMSTYLYTTVLLLIYCNHASNIVVYYLSNSQFRKEMSKLFSCRKTTKVHPFNSTSTQATIS